MEEQKENISIIIDEILEDKPKHYNEKTKNSIMKYRVKNIEKYNEFQRNYYHNKKDDPEWFSRFKERCKEHNRKYREKKKQETPPKPRGRPRKV
jgi:hypothetical protein